jgi:hypothetical protein
VVQRRSSQIDLSSNIETHGGGAAATFGHRWPQFGTRRGLRLHDIGCLAGARRREIIMPNFSGKRRRVAIWVLVKLLLTLCGGHDERPPRLRSINLLPWPWRKPPGNPRRITCRSRRARRRFCSGNIRKQAAEFGTSFGRKRPTKTSSISSAAGKSKCARQPRPMIAADGMRIAPMRLDLAPGGATFSASP